MPANCYYSIITITVSGKIVAVVAHCLPLLYLCSDLSSAYVILSGHQLETLSCDIKSQPRMDPVTLICTETVLISVASK